VSNIKVLVVLIMRPVSCSCYLSRCIHKLSLHRHAYMQAFNPAHAGLCPVPCVRFIRPRPAFTYTALPLCPAGAAAAQAQQPRPRNRATHKAPPQPQRPRLPAAGCCGRRCSAGHERPLGHGVSGGGASDVDSWPTAGGVLVARRGYCCSAWCESPLAAWQCSVVVLV
jgi:hypothetical protein